MWKIAEAQEAVIKLAGRTHGSRNVGHAFSSFRHDPWCVKVSGLQAYNFCQCCAATASSDGCRRCRRIIAPHSLPSWCHKRGLRLLVCTHRQGEPSCTACKARIVLLVHIANSSGHGAVGFFCWPGAASHLPGAPTPPPAKKESPLHVQRNLQYMCLHIFLNLNGQCQSGSCQIS